MPRSTDTSILEIWGLLFLIVFTPFLMFYGMADTAVTARGVAGLMGFAGLVATGVLVHLWATHHARWTRLTWYGLLVGVGVAMVAL